MHQKVRKFPTKIVSQQNTGDNLVFGVGIVYLLFSINSFCTIPGIALKSMPTSLLVHVGDKYELCISGAWSSLFTKTTQTSLFTSLFTSDAWPSSFTKATQTKIIIDKSQILIYLQKPLRQI